MNSTKMSCPQCGSVLKPKVYDLFAVNECLKCGGKLVEFNQLNEYVVNVTENEKLQPAVAIPIQKIVQPSLLASEMKCPIDSNKFRYINYGHDSNVMLQQCPECQVLWLKQDQITPLARYLKLNSDLLSYGENLDRKFRHSDIEQHLQTGSPFLYARSPIPLGDTTEPLAFPWMVIGLIALNILIFISESLLFPSFDQLLSTFALIPNQILSGNNLYSLVSYQFFHGNILHLIGNLYTLWIFGDNVESRFGPYKFLGFYLIAGVIAGLFATILSVDRAIPIIGSSGAIAAVMGSYLVFYPKEKLKVIFLTSIWGVTIWKYLVFWIAIQVFGFLLERASWQMSSISFISHIGGFAFGYITTLLLSRTKWLIKEANFYNNTYFEQ